MEQEKKYLRTIEEVSDALAAGKVVFCDYNKTKYHKDKNDFVIGKSEEFGDCVGDMVEISYKPYILEPKPLEVKLWHLYENKNGENVLILEEFPSKNLCGINFSTKDTAHFASNGTCLNEWSYDLVKELADLSQYFV